MPKEIWVNEMYSEQGSPDNFRYGTCHNMPSNTTKYIRADLASPDPAALVEALRDLITHAEVNDWTGIAAINSAKKALALFTGNKEGV